MAGAGFVRAALLARKGRYAEATDAITRARADRECTDLEALDLQARIYAQQGLYLHAETCWRRARRLDDGNPAYDAALNRLRRVHRASWLPWPWIAAALVALLVWSLAA